VTALHLPEAVAEMAAAAAAGVLYLIVAFQII
jgi:hypothetical protein